MDIELPRLDSYAICEQLKFSPDFQDIPLIILTVNENAVALIKTLHISMVEYVFKPFDTRALHQRIRNQLQIKTYLDYQKKQAHQYKKDLEKLSDDRFSQPHLSTQIHHELRRPINEVVAALQPMLTQIDNQQLHHLLKTADGLSLNLLNLIDDILDVIQIQSGDIALSDTSFTLQQLLEPLHSLISRFATNPATSVTFHCDERLKRQVWQGDLQRLKQILCRLIVHMIDCNPENSVMVTIRSKNNTTENIALEFEIANIGMNSAESEPLRLLSFDDMDYNTLKSSDLGVAISNHLIQMMGGTLTLNSEQGNQFFFRLYLPVMTSNSLQSCSSDDIAEIT